MKVICGICILAVLTALRVHGVFEKPPADASISGKAYCGQSAEGGSACALNPANLSYKSGPYVSISGGGTVLQSDMQDSKVMLSAEMPAGRKLSLGILCESSSLLYQGSYPGAGAYPWTEVRGIGVIGVRLSDFFQVGTALVFMQTIPDMKVHGEKIRNTSHFDAGCGIRVGGRPFYAGFSVKNLIPAKNQISPFTVSGGLSISPVDYVVLMTDADFTPEKRSLDPKHAVQFNLFKQKLFLSGGVEGIDYYKNSSLYWGAGIRIKMIEVNYSGGFNTASADIGLQQISVRYLFGSINDQTSDKKITDTPLSIDENIQTNAAAHVVSIIIEKDPDIKQTVYEESLYPTEFIPEDIRFTAYTNLKAIYTVKTNEAIYFQAAAALSKIFALSPYNSFALSQLENVIPLLTDSEYVKVKNYFQQRMVNTAQNPDIAEGFKSLYERVLLNRKQ